MNTARKGSGPRIFAASAVAAAGVLPRFLLVNWKWLVPLYAAGFAADQYFLFFEEVIVSRRSEDVAGIALAAGIESLFHLLWYGLFFTLSIQALARLAAQNGKRAFVAEPGAGKGATFAAGPTLRSPRNFAENLNQVLIETLRVLARVILWLPLLVLPGVYQYLRLFLAPVIALEDEDYVRGRVDALQRSWELTRGHTGLALVTLMVTVGAEPALNVLIASGDGAVWRNPLPVSIASLPSLVIEAWSISFLVEVYLHLKAGFLKHGAVPSSSLSP